MYNVLETALIQTVASICLKDFDLNRKIQGMTSQGHVLIVHQYLCS